MKFVIPIFVKYHIPYSGKFSPGVKFSPISPVSVPSGENLTAEFFSIDEGRSSSSLPSESGQLMTLLRCMQVLPRRSKLTDLASYSLSCGMTVRKLRPSTLFRPLLRVIRVALLLHGDRQKATMAAILNDLHSLWLFATIRA